MLASHLVINDFLEGFIFVLNLVIVLAGKVSAVFQHHIRVIEGTGSREDIRSCS